MTGWVRNLPNGDVELVAEGEASRIRQLVAWSKRGPDEAQVESVKEQSGPATGEFPGFAVMR